MTPDFLGQSTIQGKILALIALEAVSVLISPNYTLEQKRAFLNDLAKQYEGNEAILYMVNYLLEDMAKKARETA